MFRFPSSLLIFAASIERGLAQDSMLRAERSSVVQKAA